MRSNKLQLNTEKTKRIWCATSRRLTYFSLLLLQSGLDPIPSTTVRDLGVYIDSDLSMRSHVQRKVASCFAALRQIRSVHQSLPPTAMETLVVSLVITRLDCANDTGWHFVEPVVSSLSRAKFFCQDIHWSSTSAPDCTGYMRPSASNSSWRRWLTALCSRPLPVHSTNSCHWYSFSSAPLLICHHRSTKQSACDIQFSYKQNVEQQAGTWNIVHTK